MSDLSTTQVLAIVATDSTFVLKEHQGEKYWVGRCIHCNSKMTVSLSGEVLHGTIEHIIPRVHGGTNDPRNLALACRQCNSLKGIRYDRKHWKNSKLQAMIAGLQKKRLERWRDGSE